MLVVLQYAERAGLPPSAEIDENSGIFELFAILQAIGILLMTQVNHTRKSESGLFF